MVTTREYVIRRLAEGATQKAVAAEAGVSRQRVHQIASDLPLVCRCGCGGLIPPAQPGFRVYLPGHAPVKRCAECGKPNAPGSPLCHDCRWASLRWGDLTGRRFGRWKVLCLVTPGWTSARRRWWCRCKCGVVRPVWERNLKGDPSGGCAACGYAERSRRWRARGGKPHPTGG